MSAGNLKFKIEIDKDSLKRQIAEGARDAQRQGKSAGMGYGNAFTRNTDLRGGVEKELRTTLPKSERAGREGGIRYKDAFNRSCKPEVAVRVDYSEATRNGNTFTNNLQGKFSGLGSSFQGVMAGATAAVAGSIINVIGNAIGTVTNSMKTLVSEVYKVGTAAEYNSTSLTAMVGSAEKASKLISDIQKFSAATPFTSGQLVGSAKGLLASTKPEEMVEVFKQIGNAAAVAKQEGQDLGVAFQEVAAIYGKIQNKGKVTAEENNQLTERGIVLQENIAKILGVQGEKVSELMEKGKVTNEVFNQAFKTFTVGGGLATGQMDALSKTTEGLLSTMQEGFEQAGVQIFKYIQPALNEVIKQIGDSTAAVGKTSTAMSDLGKITNKWTEYLKQNPQIIQKLTELAVQLLDDGMKQLVVESDKLLKYLKENPQWVEQAIVATKEFLSALASTAQTVGQIASGIMTIVGKLQEAFGWASQLGEKLAAISPLVQMGQNLINGEGGGGNSGEFHNAGKYTVYSEGAPITRGGQLDPHHGGGDEFRRGTNNRKRDVVLAKGNNQSVPVPSPLAGTVTTAGYESGGAGHYVIVKSMDGLTATLMHFSKTLVKQGEKVARGQTLGIQGTTGHSTGIHLHGEMTDQVWDKYIKSLTSGNWGNKNAMGKAGDAIGGAYRTLTGTTFNQSSGSRRTGFLNAIKYGESDGNYNAVNSSGARGAYQFMPPTRKAIKQQYGVDAYGNRQQQDAAAIALIKSYGKQVGKDILGMIDKGNFREAASHLTTQWTSLPGGREASPKWRNRSINDFKNTSGEGGGNPKELIKPTKIHDHSEHDNHSHDDDRDFKTAKPTSFGKKGKLSDLTMLRAARKQASIVSGEYKELQTEVSEGLKDSSESLLEAQQSLTRISQGKSAVDPEIQNIKETFRNYNENTSKMISEQRELLEQAQDPTQRKQIEGNIKSLDSLLSLSKKNEQAAVTARQSEIMMEETKKAEQELIEARQKRLEDERAYNDALFEYLAVQKQKGETIKAAIKQYQEETYEKKKNQALDQASLLTSGADVLNARASTTTDINARTGLQREAGLMSIQADTTQQLSAIDDLERSGRFANSQIELLRNNVMEIGQIRIDGLKDQFQDLGGMISTEMQSAVGNFLTSVITGTETAGEALRGLVNQLLSALANMAIKQLMGGLFGGGAGGLLGFAGGSQGLIGDAFKKEHKESGGRKPRLVVANDSEMILNPKQSQEYLKLKKSGILNFAAGSMPAVPATSSAMTGTNVNIPITVNGGDKNGGGLNTPEFKREVEASVTAIILKHQTSSGGLLRKR